MSDASTRPSAVPERTTYKIIVLLILAGGLAYCNTLTKGFHLDDALWIFNNDKIGNLADYLHSLPARPVIALLTHMNYRIHGLNVFGYHLVNMSIHIAAALCLFGVVHQTLLLPRWGGRFSVNGHWLGFAVALLWVVHPLQTQAVTYIIQRCESLMGLFFLLSLYSFIRASQAAAPRGWYCLSWLSCVAGAGCKEVMVTVLPVMLCYDYVFLGPMRESIWRRGWFYGALCAIWVVPVLYALMSLSNAAPTASAGFSLPHLPPHVYMMTQAWILLHYIRLIFVPYPQSFSYRGWPLTTEFADFWPAGLAIGLLILLTAWLLYRRHWIGFLGAWFFGILSITSIVPLLDVGFEHRLYLPLAAFCALVVFAVYGLFTKVFNERTAMILGGALLCSAAAVLIVMTMIRNEDYRNTESLWLTVHQLYPNQHEALNNLASGYADENRLDDARSYYEKARAALPGMYLAEFGYGYVLCKQDEPEKGLPHLLAALQTAANVPNRNEWNSHSNFRVGLVYWMLGDVHAAEQHQRKAIQLSPKNAAACAALAVILDQQNHHEESQTAIAQAMQINPGYAAEAARKAENHLHGLAATSKWERKESLFYAQAAALTDDRNPNYGALLAEAYAANQMYAKAVRIIEKSLKTLDDSAYLTMRSQMERALSQFQQQWKKADARKDKN